MRTRGVVACVALAATVLGAVGCGDDSSNDTTQAAVTKEQYVQSVKARCAAYLTERQVAEKPLNDTFGNQDPTAIGAEELKAASDQVAALNDTTRQVLSDLEDLPRPEADSAALDQAFANFDDAQAALDEADQAAADGDGAAMGASFKKLDAALNGNREILDEFGFSTCG